MTTESMGRTQKKLANNWGPHSLSPPISGHSGASKGLMEGTWEYLLALLTCTKWSSTETLMWSIKLETNKVISVLQTQHVLIRSAYLWLGVHTLESEWRWKVISVPGILTRTQSKNQCRTHKFCCKRENPVQWVYNLITSRAGESK